MRIHRNVAALMGMVSLLLLPMPIARGQSEIDTEVARPWEVQHESPAFYDKTRQPNLTTTVDLDGLSFPDEVGTALPMKANEPRVFIETWLPQQLGTNPAPQGPFPVIFTASVERNGGTCEGTSCDFWSTLVPRGYAFSVIHVPGSGRSPGCIDRHGQREAAAMSAAVEYLAGWRPDSNGDWATTERDPEDGWSNGDLGGVGVSFKGGTVANVAARGTQAARDAIDALVVGAPHISDYESQWTFDGVRSTGIPPAHAAIYMAWYPGVAPGGALHDAEPKLDPDTLWRTHECHREVLAENATNFEANVTPYYRERDIRLLAQQITAPTFVFHGHSDIEPWGGVPPMVQAGFFEQLGSKQKFGLFGVWGHELPSNHKSGFAVDGERADFGPGAYIRNAKGNKVRVDFGPGLVTAWFDHWVRGRTQVGADTWPTVQVQGTDGQWRIEPDWPTTGGPVGQLALGPAGSLGDPHPSGASSFVERVASDLSVEDPMAAHHELVFETAPLRQRLQITGQPVADLWVRLDRPDAHIAAALEIIAADGSVMGETSATGTRTQWTYGLRSLRHLDELQNNVFVQETGREVLAGEPVRVPVRFQPTDLVVPVGGKVRLTLSGSIMVNPGLQQVKGFPANDPLLGFSEPSGLRTTVTVLHDCDEVAPIVNRHAGAPMVSTLRFLMPREDPDLINVRERSEFIIEKGAAQDPLPTEEVSDFASDGGLATAPVCGEPPSRIEDVISTLGPEIPYEAPNWRPDASLDISPQSISGNGPIDITAAVIDYDGAFDIVQADLTILDANDRLIAAWDLDDFAFEGDWRRVMSASGLKLSGPSPWTVTLATTDRPGDSDVATTEIVRIDDEEGGG